MRERGETGGDGDGGVENSSLLLSSIDIELSRLFLAGGKQTRPGRGTRNAEKGSGQPGQEAVEVRLHRMLSQVQLAHHASLQRAHEERRLHRLRPQADVSPSAGCFETKPLFYFVMSV